ncbi:TPA: hypothetical protein DEP90_01780 [Patescibacteria group bacterium]|nr:hypothetical protein [Patescibacteria group bacterium]
MKRITPLKSFLLLLYLTTSLYYVIRITQGNPLSLETLLLSLIGCILIGSLFYLAYFDLKEMSVHNIISLILMLFLFLLNLSIYFTKGSEYSILIGNNFVFSPYQNFLSTIILGSISQLIVLVTKEKALGLGDVRIAIICGLLIGYQNLFLWTNITVFSALFYGLILVIKKKRFKGIKIPFVPFMVLGVIIILLLKV